MKFPWQNASDILPHDPSYNLSAHLKRVQDLHVKYSLNTEDKCIKHCVSLIPTDLPEHIFDPLFKALYQLFIDNNLYLPNTPSLEYRPYLVRMQAYLTDGKRLNEAEKNTRVFINYLTRYIPHTSGLFHVPLLNVIPEPAFITKHISSIFSAQTHEPVFLKLHATLYDNAVKASGHDPKTFTVGKITWASEAKGTPAEISKTYLKDTPLLDLFDIPVPLEIPIQDFASHAVIIAPSRWGKSQLLGTFLARFLQEKDPVGAILLDPHGDLFKIARTRVDPQRLIVLDPDEDPPPLNFLDFSKSTPSQALQSFKYLMSALTGGLSDKQGAIVPYILTLLRTIPDASIETLRNVVDEKVKTAQASQFYHYIEKLPAIDRGFFESQFYGQGMQVTKEAIGWKLYAALQSEAFRKMFGAKENTLDADACLRDRKIVLVKGARTTLNDDGMQVFLQFIVSQFYTAALRREHIPIKDRHLCVLIADEMKYLLTPQIDNILTECRKYGLGWLGATQLIDQIPREIKAAMYGSTAIKMVGKLQSTDAIMLSREMDTNEQFIRSLDAVPRSHSEWALHVLASERFPRNAMKVTLKYGQLEAMPEFPQPPKLPRTIRPTPSPPPPSTPQTASSPQPTTPKPATNPPHPEQERTPVNRSTRDPDTDYHSDD